MKIDWQMCEDGLLEPEEMRRAEQALASDEGARKELQGLREFRKVVRSSALQEPVPLGRLKAILRGVVGRERQPAWRLYGALAATAAVAAALTFFAVGQFPSGADEETYQSLRSPAAAQIWAMERSGLELPAIELASLGKMKGVHSEGDWACYDFMVSEQLVHLYMEAGKPEPNCETVVTDGRTFYLPPGTDNVCFSSKGVTFTVFCGDEVLRWKVAKLAAKEADLVY